MNATNRLVLLSEQEVSEWITVPISTLRDWRQKRINIPWIPLSDRKIRYDEAAVTGYLKSIEVQVETKKPGVAAPGNRTTD